MQERKKSEEKLYRIRHSLAHIMAQAVVEIRPGAKLGFGPPIEDGFYYDFILPEPITDSDFPEIEKRMRRLIHEGHRFEREELQRDLALKRIEEMGEPYKREYAQELLQKQNLSRRLGLVFTGSDNQDHHPFIIHRAPLGTHERFVAFLIEHYGGAFPTWLAPIQVRVVPVSDRFNDYACKIVTVLRDQFIRAEADLSPDTMGKKIRNAVTQKILNILVVGEREQADSSVTLRRYNRQEQQTMSVDAFRDWVIGLARSRALEKIG